MSGHPGAGKTTVRKMLAATLRCESFYAGDMVRALSAETPIEDFYVELGKHPEIEAVLDERQAQLLRMHEHIILEGRVAPFLAPNIATVKILLTVTPEEGARRQQLRPENQRRSIAELIEGTRKRISTERQRYQTLYHIPDHLDPACFDVVLDTTHASPQEVIATILKRIKTLKPHM